MRLLSYIAGATVVLSGCATQKPSPPEAPQPVESPRVATFRARTVTSRGLVTDDVVGSAEVRQRDIRVVLRSGFVELTASSGARPRGLRAILAYGDTANWNLRFQSSSVPVSAIHARGDTLTDSVVFSIPLPQQVVLRDHWIALLLEADVNVPGRGFVPGSFRPIHSSPAMFATVDKP